MKQNNLKIISLFSGCGGMDLGFRRAGLVPFWANEYDSDIWETYRFNHPNVFLETRSIKELDVSEIPDCDGIIGGPPCQSWSEGGRMLGFDDARGTLFLDYIRIIKGKQPLFFVAENVAGMLSEIHNEALCKIQSSLKEAGYRVSLQLLNASDYGVPQDRKRIFFVGVRNDLNFDFEFPSPTTDVLKIALKQAIGDIHEPPIAVDKMHLDMNQYSEFRPNHEYYNGAYSENFMSRNRVRGWNEVSFTIQALAKNNPIHPQAPKMIYHSYNKRAFVKGYEHLYRRLSVRECARIQTFPDSFIFKYNSIGVGYKMVGNAVPVRLAEVVAKQIVSQLESKGIGVNKQVLIAYYKNEKHLKWILANGIYNMRTKDQSNAKELLKRFSSVKYLVLYSYFGTQTTHVFKIEDSAVQIQSRDYLMDLNYPSIPKALYYLLFSLSSSEFDLVLNLRKLRDGFHKDYKEFTLISLKDLRQYFV